MDPFAEFIERLNIPVGIDKSRLDDMAGLPEWFRVLVEANNVRMSDLSRLSEEGFVAATEFLLLETGIDARNVPFSDQEVNSILDELGNEDDGPEGSNLN